MENKQNPLWHEGVDVDEEIDVNPEKASYNLYEDIKCLLEGHISQPRVQAWLSEHNLVAVPVEPTGAIRSAIVKTEITYHTPGDIYKAMIAAASKG